MSHSSPTCVFCPDVELGYERSRTRFEAGAGFTLDETYRLAHLPLVAPSHPRIIETREGSSYVMGRHERVFSLVLPVSGNLLLQSPVYRELDAEMKASPFASKIAWDVMGRRRDKLHATICGSLSTDVPPVLDRDRRQALTELGPIAVELRGVFSGNVNRGRLYLRAYPESRNGVNVFQRIQRSLGCRETDLYVVGLYNMTDDLDVLEAAALAALIDRWWSRVILRFEIDHLWLLAARDDLVLDSRIEESVSLV